LLVVDEPDLRSAKPPRSLIPLATVVTTNVVQGNFLPSYPADCASGPASFLSGDRSGLPAAQLTLEFSCGLALDQAWMPLQFANEIGADWCGGLIGTAPADSTTYPAGFGCNFPINAFAVQDPGKSIGVTGLQLSPPLAGQCQAPFQKFYIGLCTLTTPLPSNTPGPFTMTLARALPTGAEFGFTAASGSTQRNFPMREVDALAAAQILTNLMNAYPHFADVIGGAREALGSNNLAKACEIMKHEVDVILVGAEHAPGGPAVADGFHEALRAIDCDSR
jgi:hypothetical protein